MTESRVLSITTIEPGVWVAHAESVEDDVDLDRHPKLWWSQPVVAIALVEYWDRQEDDVSDDPPSWFDDYVYQRMIPVTCSDGEFIWQENEEAIALYHRDEDEYPRWIDESAKRVIIRKRAKQARNREIIQIAMTDAKQGTYLPENVERGEVDMYRHYYNFGMRNKAAKT